MVVGPSDRFLSGISQYTARLSCALAEDRPDPERVSLLLLRRLCPEAFYPGRLRVGEPLASLGYPERAPRFDGVDYHWMPSLIGALRFLQHTRPDVVILQWWTATVGHTHLALAAAARRLGARVVVELHETLDIGEQSMPLVSRYGAACLRHLIATSSGAIVHSQADRERIAPSAPGLPIAVVTHPPFDQYAAGAPSRPRDREPGRPVELLYFGVIRPHKGLDDLVDAFTLLRRQGVPARLTVAGEVWQGYDAPLERLESGPFAADVRIRRGYVPDSAVPGLFRDADLMVAPYRQASASGPLAIAIARGLPVVVSDVPALAEVVADYGGAVLAPRCDPEGLAAAILRAMPLVGTTYRPIGSWCDAGRAVSAFLDQIAPERARGICENRVETRSTVAVGAR